MTDTIRGLSPGFDHAVTEVLAVLDTTSTRLERMYASAENLLAENDLDYLLSLSQLAEQRGLHLVDEIPPRMHMLETDDLADLTDQLAAAHDDLIENSSALDDFVVLEFVNEIGALCRGMRRYVEHD